MNEYDYAYIIERCNGVCFEAIEIIHDLRAQIASLQSQPRLQPVTPEAMAELEGDEVRRIAVLHQWSCKTMVWVPRLRQWHSGTGCDNPLEWGWFIELSTIPEVQQ